MTRTATIPSSAIEALVASETTHGRGESPAGTSELEGWMNLVAQQQLDLPLSPQWSWMTAKTGGFDAQFRAVAADDAAGRLGYAAFIEYSTNQLGIPLRFREMPGCQLVCYHAALVAERDAEKLLDAVIRHDGRQCDVLYVPEVVRGGAADALIANIAKQRGWHLHRMPSARAPYVPITGTWAAHLAARSSNFRYNIKRKQKALAAKGAVTERWFTAPDSVAELLASMASIEGASWKAEADMAITGSRRETEYYALLLPWLARRDALQANVVFVDGEPAAYSLCYVWCGRMAQMKTSFSERFAEASPGVVVTSSTIQRAHELGLSEFDFLGDVMPHKSQWTTLTRDHDHLYLYTGTLRSRLASTLKRLAQRMRPEVRKETVGRSGFVAKD